VTISTSTRGRSIKAACTIARLVFILFSVTSVLPAQEAGGTIVGAVTDANGGTVGNATVTIKNVETGVARTVPTNADGLFVAPNLVPGSYQVAVEAAGFASTEVSGVTLTVGERREINVQLKVGEVSQKITVVSAQISDVQLASSSVGNVVDSHTIVDLPLNGRDWTSLTLLQPGVAQVRTQKTLGISNDRPNRGLGVDITIGGNRPQGNNYRLDGISINDYSSGAPGSITGGVIGVDAVQEFSIVTSNAPADYGKTSGGIINAASRSGTNSFHGTAYEFLRNSKLDTRNFFDKGNAPPPFKRNQFGGSAGGRIFKDRTFFFADYEGLRQGLSTTTTLTVPSQAVRNGTLCSKPILTDPGKCSTTQLPANSKTDANGVNLAVKPFLALFPLPPDGALIGNGDTGVVTFVGKQITTEDFATTRIDHRLSASDSLFGTYVFDRGQATNPDAYNFKSVGNQSRRHTVALEQSHIFSPTLLNSARLGFNRDVVIAFTTLGAINPAAADTAFGFNPGSFAGIITVGSGVTQFSGGLGAIGEYHFHYNSFQFYDDLYWTRNKHSLKLGFSVERIQSNQFTRGVSPNGFYIFGGISSFLQNLPTSYNSLLSSSISPRDLRQTLYSGYVQDDYKLRKKLTLNLGLRYEMATVPTETANQLATLVNLTDSAPHLGSPYFSNPSLRNFAPRVGFAWDPFGTSRTSVRGAFGIYDILPLPYQFQLLTLLSAPFTASSTYSFPAPNSTDPNRCDRPTVQCFPKGFSFLQNGATTNLRYGYVDPKPRRSYVEQWSLNIQRELFPTFTVTAGYVGSHGVHLPYHSDDINDRQPMSLSPAGWLWPKPAEPGPRLFTNIGGQVSANNWAASSTYHGLNLEVIKRLSHGIQIQGSYTWSKSMDTSSSGIAGDTFGNSVSSLPFFDARLRRGLSDFDVRHILAINALWMIPGPQSWSSVPKWAASGWQLGGIFTLTSGLPFTPTIGGDPLGLKSGDNYAFPDRVPGCNLINTNYRKDPQLDYVNTNCFSLPKATPAIAAQCIPFIGRKTLADPEFPGTCANLLGNSGRNIVIGPGLRNLDLSLFKNNPIRQITETFNVQFRWEVFNVANHANFNPPLPGARQIFTAGGVRNTAGILASPTITTSRQMQFALKFVW